MPSATSDGISTNDWNKVTMIALEIANESVTASEQRLAELAAKMLSLLDKLLRKYGERPSLLATKADYVANADDRCALLTRAFEISNVENDRRNKLLTSSSLVEFYLEEAIDVDKGRRWLHVLRQCLIDTPDEEAQATYERLCKR